MIPLKNKSFCSNRKGAFNDYVLVIPLLSLLSCCGISVMQWNVFL